MPQSARLACQKGCPAYHDVGKARPHRYGGGCQGKRSEFPLLSSDVIGTDESARTKQKKPFGRRLVMVKSFFLILGALLSAVGSGIVYFRPDAPDFLLFLKQEIGLPLLTIPIALLVSLLVFIGLILREATREEKIQH